MAKKKTNTAKTLRHVEPRRGRVIKNTGSSYLVRLDPPAENFASDHEKKQPDSAAPQFTANNVGKPGMGQTGVARAAAPEEIDCRIKGNFRIKGIRTTNPVAVGDIVEISLRDEDTQYITSILPRKNYIIRRASNLSKESHILASNIDQAILVVSIVNPQTPTTFIDRFLATAEAYNVPALLAINKADLWDADDAALADAIAYLYNSLGYKTIIVSAKTGRGLDELREITKDKISLMAGNSGVGKSSLINALAPHAELRTGSVSDMHHTGTHTTTFSEMVDLPYGGALIDVPGVKGFGVIDFQPEEVSHFFPEIFRIGAGCKYGNCSHTAEPGCAVIPAVENSEIAASRYASYLSILEEASEAAGADKYRKPF